MTDHTQDIRTTQKDRGRDASSPMGIPWKGWKDIVFRVGIGIFENRIMLTAAGVTFYMLLGLVPSLSLFVTLYGLFTDASSVIGQLDLIRAFVPSGGMGIIQDQLMRLTEQNDRSLGITLIISFVGIIWGAGSGIRALFEAMNVVYGEKEKRNFFQINLLALGFIFGGVIIISLMLTTVLIIPIILSAFYIGFGWLVQLGSYAVMIVALIVALAALYRWGPSRREAKWRWITPGSIFAIVFVGIISLLFSWYVANFGNYNATYGSLGALIALLTWIWISVTIVILGGSINSEIEHQTARDSTRGPGEKPLGKRGAYVADTVGGRWPASGGSTPDPHEDDPDDPEDQANTRDRP